MCGENPLQVLWSGLNMQTLHRIKPWTILMWGNSAAHPTTTTLFHIPCLCQGTISQGTFWPLYDLCSLCGPYMIISTLFYYYALLRFSRDPARTSDFVSLRDAGWMHVNTGSSHDSVLMNSVTTVPWKIHADMTCLSRFPQTTILLDLTDTAGPKNL